MSSRRFRRVLLIVGGLLVVAGATTWALLHYLSSRTAAVVYTSVEIKRGDVLAQVTATGTLSPVVLVAVGTQVSGTIKELGADFNSQVKAGQVIARLDPRFFEGAVSSARARVVSAKADLRRAEAAAVNARAQYNRLRPLVDKGISPASDLDASLAEQKSTVAQVEVAKAAILQADAALEQAQVNLAYTTIAAPIDGLVISRNVDVGQTVAASLQSPTLFVIAGNLREMEVHTSVAESDVGQVREGMRAEFSVDAFPGQRFIGEVKQVRYQATTVSNVVTYDAVIRVDNERLVLRPGMTASVTFIIDQRRDVLVVPTRALRYRPAAAVAAGAPARKPTLWLLREGEPVAVAIEPGLSDGTVTQIAKGEVREGERVITSDSQTRAATPATTPSRGGAPRPPRIL